MNRKEKIELIKKISSGKNDLFGLIIESAVPLPSWYWQQFETEKDLLKDLEQIRGEGVQLLWQDGKPFAIGGNKKHSENRTWF